MSIYLVYFPVFSFFSIMFSIQLNFFHFSFYDGNSVTLI